MILKFSKNSHSKKDIKMYCINEDDYQTVMKILSVRNKNLFEKLSTLQQTETITKRSINKKNQIKEVITELLNDNEEVTKYKVHKRTNIAYVTINKYYDVILKESLKDVNSKRGLFL